MDILQKLNFWRILFMQCYSDIYKDRAKMTSQFDF